MGGRISDISHTSAGRSIKDGYVTSVPMELTCSGVQRSGDGSALPRIHDLYLCIHKPNVWNLQPDPNAPRISLNMDAISDTSSVLAGKHNNRGFRCILPAGIALKYKSFREHIWPLGDRWFQMEFE